MVKYEKTKSGYCYEVKNGKKTRISLEDYKKKSKNNQGTNGSRTTKGAAVQLKDIHKNPIYQNLLNNNNPLQTMSWNKYKKQQQMYVDYALPPPPPPNYFRRFK